MTYFLIVLYLMPAFGLFWVGRIRLREEFEYNSFIFHVLLTAMCLIWPVFLGVSIAASLDKVDTESSYRDL